MEALIVLLFLVVGVAVLAGLLTPIHSAKPVSTTGRNAEALVTAALQSLSMQSYVVFKNLVIPSEGATSHTEIDHVVVSPFGIFCIETKGHHGNIYGNSKSKYWRQYLGKQEFELFSPYRQNYKHIRALAALLGENLKTPIHSYVVMPNAYVTKIDGEQADFSIRGVIRKIEKHNTPYYNLSDCERILKTLAYASEKSEDLLDAHVREVSALHG
jgi:hypothetical protein